MENAKQAYDAFNRLWQKVPRSIRADRENNQRMLEIRAYFDELIEAGKRAAIVNSALGATPDASTPEPEAEDEPTPVHLALRLLRTLDRREWEMVKAIVDLHKFSTADFLDLLDEIQDTHCPRCGEWLDDDDAHENCPVPEEDEEDEASTNVGVVEKISPTPAVVPVVAGPQVPVVASASAVSVVASTEEARVPAVIGKPDE